MTTEIKYADVDGQVSEILNKTFVTSFRNGYLKANDVVLPVYYRKFGQRILDMEIRDDDVWVCSYPKTGLKFTQTYIPDFRGPILSGLYERGQVSNHLTSFSVQTEWMNYPIRNTSRLGHTCVGWRQSLQSIFYPLLYNIS